MTLASIYLDCAPLDAPAFGRLADRIEAGEDVFTAGDHLTEQQRQYAARVLCAPRPLDPWMWETAREVVVVKVRGMRL